MARADFEAGLVSFRAGRFAEARDRLDRAVRAAPADADAWMLLGLTRRRLGDVDGAVDALERAVAADPEHGPAWANLGVARVAAGRVEAAAEALRAAIPRLGDARGPRLELAKILLNRGDLAGAGEVVAPLSAADPDAATVRASVALGRGELASAFEAARAAGVDDPVGALAGLAESATPGGPTRAVVALQALVAAAPGRAEPRLALARALRDVGRLDQALGALDGVPAAAAAPVSATILELKGELPGARALLEGVVARAPDDGAAWHNLARVRARLGELAGALDAQGRAVAADPFDRARWIAWVDLVAAAGDAPPAHDALLARATQVGGVAVQGLERALRRRVWAQTRASDWDALLATGDPEAAARLAAALDHPLAHAWLRRTRALGPVAERRLTALRRADLHHDALGPHLAVRVSLAIQAVHTGHAWIEEADDAAVLDAEAADPGAWPARARRAAWRPPPDSLSAPADADLAELYRVAVAEPARDRALAAAVPALDAPDDAGSAEVRAQYEEHPYPRLIGVHVKPPASLPALLAQIAPHVGGVPDRAPLRVLVAGCGTGQQVLAAATRYRDARVLAVDLSRASLGVAARKIAEYGVADRVRLLRADLLTLGRLDERFDVIECGGVLHHLRVPLDGLRVLVGLLAPGGLMKLGLYSEVARQDVVAARAVLDAAGLGTSPDALRRGRRLLLDLPDDHPANPVVWSPDFPSLAGFRDLVRHACEHRYTLDRLGDELRAVGLELLAFQHPDPRPAAWYAARFPDDPAQRDLGRWAEVEAAHPACFRGMYQFWCRLQAEPTEGSASMS
jgi:tetratricopeptide (TPR) repeat protein/SAM-dependent methyltransferase